MKYVVAVSGGVDSVVLLDMLVQEWQNTEGTRRKPSFSGRAEFWDSLPKRDGGQSPPVVVAHFDHGIREDSTHDAQFVAELARRHGLPFETKREVLGKDASEELARDRRYAFLREVAKKYDATIVTAHHMNDIAETIAINVTRGTGWRGVAALASDVHRPLLGMMKQEIIAYAREHHLEWREDSTNATDAYLRNRLRSKLTDDDTVRQLAALRARQVELRNEIDNEVRRQLGTMNGSYSRYFFTHIDSAVAAELLRGLAVQVLGRSLLRPQLERTLLAIKTARPDTTFPFGEVQLIVGKKEFCLSVKAS